MKLTEYKTKIRHYYLDENGRFQGEYKEWHTNGQLEYHCFYIEGELVINFKNDPELYPKTPEQRTFFTLRYGSGMFLPTSEDNL